MTRCWLSETHVAITPEGTMKPCTRYKDTGSSPNINVHKLKDVFSDDYFNGVRNSLKSGVFPSACSKCSSQEKIGVMSMRQIFNSGSDFEILTDTSDDIRSLEIAFSNHCNYRCRHCNSFSSAKWKKEDELLGREIPSRMLLEPNIGNLDINNLVNLEHIKILGGEPLINKSHTKFIQEFSNRDCSGITLEYYTNASVFPTPDIIEIWKSFKKVSVHISLEDIGEYFNYFRTDGDFYRIVEPICVSYDGLSKEIPNIIPSFHITLNALNVYRIDQVVSYIFENFPEWKITVDTVINPDWLKIDQWSKEYADTFCKTLQHVKYKTNIQQNKDAIEYMCRIISARCINNVCNFKELIKYNMILDKNRDTDLLSTHSSIYKIARGNKL